MITKKTKKRRTIKDIFFSVFLGLFFLAIISCLVYSNWKINQKRTTLQVKIEELKKNIQSLEEKKREREKNIARTKEESYWEGIAREQGFGKEGEEEIVVLPPEKNEEDATKFEKNLWQKFLEKIGF